MPDGRSIDALAAADLRFERIIFFNHLSIIGGMLAFVAFGAGCFSLDAAMGRKSA